MNHSGPQLDPQRLVDEYFLRDFSEQEIAELNVALAMNPELKAAFMKSLHDDLDLYETMQHMQEEQRLRERTQVYTQRRSARAIRQTRINRIAAALVVVLSVGGLVYHMLHRAPAPGLADRSEESMPMVTDVDSAPAEAVLPETPRPAPAARKKQLQMVARMTDLFLLDGKRIWAKNDAESRPLRVGDLLAIDDALTVPAGGRLSMKYLSDSTTLSFAEQSSFKILESEGGKHLEFHDGQMVADVAKQNSGKPFRITTDDAELVVLGTRFELINRKETVLSVLSGKVQMHDLFNDDSVSVPAGYLAASHQGKLSRPRAFRHEKLKPVYNRTLPEMPRNHKKAGDKYIVVDPERNLRGRVDFIIPRLKGRIVKADMRLRVVPFGTDFAGGGDDTGQASRSEKCARFGTAQRAG